MERVILWITMRARGHVPAARKAWETRRANALAAKRLAAAKKAWETRRASGLKEGP